MSNKKKIIIIFSLVLFLLIAIFGIINIKKLDDNVYHYNVADSSNYYTAKIDLNGASSIDSKTLRCQIEVNGCYITLPKATRNKGVVLGFSDQVNDTVAKYQMGSKILINDNVNLYVISYQDNTLTVDNNNVDYLENDHETCRIYNSEKSCKVILPLFNKNGYENKGYSTSKESLTGFIYGHDDYELSKNTTIYPIYSTSSRHKAINVEKIITYQDSFIEIENGCSESVYSNLLSYLDGINDKAEFLLIGNKISFLTDNTFDEIWGKKYVGMNYGPKSLRSVDIRCSATVINDYYATMVHEMAHSWDFFYAKKLKDNISSQSDIINLYNKYINQKDTVFREYSYSNLYEFVADMMRYYYFKYYVPRLPFKNFNYPNDIKNTLEKYICISKSNYEKDYCQ